MLFKICYCDNKLLRHFTLHPSRSKHTNRASCSLFFSTWRTKWKVAIDIEGVALLDHFAFKPLTWVSTHRPNTLYELRVRYFEPSAYPPNWDFEQGESNTYWYLLTGHVRLSFGERRRFPQAGWRTDGAYQRGQSFTLNFAHQASGLSAQRWSCSLAYTNIEIGTTGSK